MTEGGVYEAHVACRLAGDRPEGGASDFPIDALGTSCEMLGVSQLHGKNVTLGKLSDAELVVATSAGLRLLDESPAEIAT